MTEHERESVAIYSSYNLNLTGGAEKSILTMLNRWKNFDWLYASHLNIPELPCPTWQLGASARLPFIRRPLTTLKETRKTAQFLIQNEWILFESFSLPSMQVLLALPPATRRERCLIMWRSEQFLLPPDFDSSQKNNIAYKINWLKNILIKRYLANQVRFNLVTSKATARSLVKIGIRPETIRIIPEQVGGEFTPELRIQSGENLRLKFLDHDELGILVVSRVTPEKDLIWIVKLFDLLRRERCFLHPDSSYKKIKISLVGPVREQNKWYFDDLIQSIRQSANQTSINHAADSVSFSYLGCQPWERLQEIYCAYDILFHPPEKREGFGRVIVEAMSSGMTVIARQKCAAIAEILQQPPYQIGILVDTPDEAVEYVLRLMSSPEVLNQLQENASRWANNHYSLEAAEKDFLNILKDH